MTNADLIQLALALKPFHDFVKSYDHNNSYRPDYPANVTLVEGINLQHAINAHDAYERLMNS